MNKIKIKNQKKQFNEFTLSILLMLIVVLLTGCVSNSNRIDTRMRDNQCVNNCTAQSFNCGSRDKPTVFFNSNTAKACNRELRACINGCPFRK